VLAGFVVFCALATESKIGQKGWRVQSKDNAKGSRRKHWKEGWITPGRQDSKKRPEERVQKRAEGTRKR
jgi:hypothetical protein